jgi:hypothetical protein
MIGVFTHGLSVICECANLENETIMESVVILELERADEKVEKVNWVSDTAVQIFIADGRGLKYITIDLTTL